MSESARQKPFWKYKTLSEMSPQEWESLCDGCGKCCLHKLEDADSGELHYTNVACRLLNLQSCRCSRYAERSRWVPDCVRLTPANIDELYWMPATCAYRLLAEGKDLPSWHPLVSGNPASVHTAGVSVQSWAVSETQAGEVEDHIIDWSP
jgi:uncharacterized cysteine cluster protein YcgN (CxxCxxCC family)